MTHVETSTLRLGTRASQLAMVQAHLVADALREAGTEVDIVTISTDGDRRAPDTPWGEGAFVTAIEAALLAGEIDLAVHSAKDVPTAEDPALRIAAYLPRQASEDVLVLPRGGSLRSVDDLPVGARVGTDSPRRTAFLRALRPDLDVHPLHGNVDTRLRRLDDGATDALVLAAAGLRRLDRADRIALVLDPSLVPPAPGQGALAVQVRAADDRSAARVRRLDHAPTRAAVTLERAILAAAGGGCRAPLGVSAARTPAGDMRVMAGYARADGRVVGRVAMTLPAADPRALSGASGTVLAALVDQAAASLRAAHPTASTVVVARAAEDAGATALALVDRGIVPMVVPVIASRPGTSADLDRAAAALGAADWIVVTSRRAVAPLVDAATRRGTTLAAASAQARWAVVGAATARALEGAGIRPHFVPTRSAGLDLADELPIAPGDAVLLPRADLAGPDIPRRLSARGARVEEATVYRTLVGPDEGRGAMAAAVASSPSAVVLASPSGVDGWIRLAASLGADTARRARAIPVVAIGATTAAAIERHELRLAAVAQAPTPAATVQAVERALSTEDTR